MPSEHHSLDGSASYGPPGDWGGYWGKQGPELLDHRLAAYDGEQRMVFGATTFGLFVQMLPVIGAERDPWLDRMLSFPATVVSSTLQGPFDWPDATVAKGDAVQIARRMKEESEIAAQTGDEPVWAGAGDFDLDVLEARTLDGRTQELVYRPTLRTWPAERP